MYRRAGEEGGLERHSTHPDRQMRWLSLVKAQVQSEAGLGRVDKIFIVPCTFGVTLISFLGWSQMVMGAGELGGLAEEQVIAASGTRRWQFCLSGHR